MCSEPHPQAPRRSVPWNVSSMSIHICIRTSISISTSRCSTNISVNDVRTKSISSIYVQARRARLGAYLHYNIDDLGVVAAARLAQRRARFFNGVDLLPHDVVEHVVRHAVTVDDDAPRRRAGRVALHKGAEQFVSHALQPGDLR